MQINEIHKKAIHCANECNRSEIALIEVLELVIKNEVYKRLNYPTLHVYITDALHLSDAQAYYFARVAEKAMSVPKLKAALEKGILTDSQAKRITKVVTESNSELWIEKAATLPQRQIEKQVAIADPKHSPPEKIKFMNEEEAYLSTAITVETEERLRRLKDVLSQKMKTPCSLKDVLDYVTKDALERIDPVKRAGRSIRSKQGAQPGAEQGTGKAGSLTIVQTPLYRRFQVPIAAAAKHEVTLRDESQCTELVNGKRCTQRRWLQIHHLKHVANGGTNTVSNLTTLCSFHHRVKHLKPVSQVFALTSRSTARRI